MKRPRSIRRFLLSGIFTLVSISLAISAVIGSLEANHEMEELFDARLAQSARITNQLLQHYQTGHQEELTGHALYEEWQTPATMQESGQPGISPAEHGGERNLAFQLFDAKGDLLLRSPAAPPHPLIPLAPGFSSVDRDQHRWRTFTLYNEAQQSWLIVAERDDERSELARKIATLTMLPLFITLPFLLALLWWLVVRGLAPLRSLAQAISERHPANLSPLNLKIRAQELTPLTNEINRLMLALADTIEREKQFTNEAAHELRTPLAVLRIHSENALAATDEASREQSLHKMLLALDRSDRLLRQLLTLARIDNEQTLVQQTLDLGQMLQTTLATLAPLALRKDQQLSLESPPHLLVQGQHTLLDLMFSNLIDNALRYTPNEGEIAVRICQEGGRIRVDVQDNGPGIPSAALSRLSERFFRVNPQHGDGVGLGMAIVKRIAQLHGAEFDIHNRQTGGIEVSIWLPAATTTSVVAGTG